MDKLNREKLHEMMKNDKEIEKLVDEYGVDGVICITNNVIPLVIPIFESIIDGLKGLMATINEAFNKAEVDDDFLKLEVTEDTFQKALAMCDVDIKWRYEYLDSLMCDLSDESMALYEEIERAKIDEEIAEGLIDYDVDARKDLIYANTRVVSLTKELEELECRMEVVNDLYDEVFCGIIANLN